MTVSIDISQLRRWISREEAADDEISVATARKFHATLDLTGPPPSSGDEAPPLIHYALCPPLTPTSRLGPDGHAPTGDFLPPVPLPRRMWAGSALRFHAPLRVGQAVRRLSRIADIDVKDGRTGKLCFVSVSHRWEAEGRIVIEETQDLVYREAASRDRPATEPAPASEAVVDIPCGPELLFRYSALTFNTHRIHYDRPYATDVESYTDLVVHGPLQATLLLHHAIASIGTCPSDFRFRGISPLCLPGPIQLHRGAYGEHGLRLWSTRVGGSVAMMAQARWC